MLRVDARIGGSSFFIMNNISIHRQGQVIKRQPAQIDTSRLPLEKERIMTLKAKSVLLYVACINYAMYGLESELKDSGKYKHKVAHYFKIAQKIANNAHNWSYNMFATGAKDVGLEYNKEFDSVWSKIDGCILLPNEEKDYNIIIALCRIVERLSKEVIAMYYFPFIENIVRIPSLLSHLGIEDYKVENIIERSVGNV